MYLNYCVFSELTEINTSDSECLRTVFNETVISEDECLTEIVTSEEECLPTGFNEIIISDGELHL